MVKKGQAAMEFLMTYGWAILVVLIALGALFFLGVFDPKTPSTCTVAAPLTCGDSKAFNPPDAVTSIITVPPTDQSNISIVVGATGVSSATISAVTITAPTGVTQCGIAPNIAMVHPVSEAAPSEASFECTGLWTVGSKYSGTAVATYTLQGSPISHTSTISFQGTVE